MLYDIVLVLGATYLVLSIVSIIIGAVIGGKIAYDYNKSKRK